jgi:hypothetical protein
LEEGAQLGAGARIVADPLGEDVAGAGERLLGARDLGGGVLAVVGRVLATDVGGRGGGEVRARFLGEDEIGKRLDPFP